MSDFVKNTAPLLALLLYTLAVSFLFGAALKAASEDNTAPTVMIAGP